MKYLKYALSAVMVLLATLLQAQTNVLRVESVETPAGKTLTLPVTLDNSSDITGVQFDISVPFQLALDDDGKPLVSLSKTRANGHTVVVRSMGQDWYNYNYVNSTYYYYYKYRIIVYSDNNALLIDNSGTLLTLQLTTDANLPDGTEMAVRLSNVTLSDTQMQNVRTGTTNGTVTIKEIPRPDLTPADITFTETETGPGQTLNVAWKVKNVGREDAQGGWTEEIALVNSTGKIVKTIATTHSDGPLAIDAEVSRNVQVQLPQLLGIDGVAQVQVTIIADSDVGEPQVLRDNNVAKSAGNVAVKKQLTLEVTPQRISESQYWQRITLKLSRSGKWNSLQTFKVTTTNSAGEPSAESRVALPQLITIQAGEASALVYMTITNNSVLDDDELIHFRVEDTEEVGAYAAVEADLVIEDDEQPQLSVTASQSEMTEGESFTLTITAGRAPKQDLTVTLSSENSKRFSMPSTVTLPAGETTVTASVTAVDDDLANGTQSYKLTASAPNYIKGDVLVLINDNDLPVLELQLTPTTVQESDGPVCVAGVLRRVSNIDKKVTVKLTDDAAGGLYFGNRTLTLDKGVQTVNFNFGPVDNQQQEGDRTYTVTAAVWLSSCSCDAQGESAGHVSAQLTVLDNDGPALMLTAAQGTVKEGGQTTLTIARNNDATEPLTVTLASDYDDNLDYDHTITIPAGQTSVAVTVTSKTNAVAGDSHTVVFTASTGGYATGSCFLMVTDQTLPDAVIKSIGVKTDDATAGIGAAEVTVLVGDAVTVGLEIGNEGNSADLPAATTLKIYDRGISEALAQFVIDTPLPVGQTRLIEKRVTLPKTVGTHQLYAVINRENGVQELSTTNNTSPTASVVVNSPFSAALETDKAKYSLQDVVIFSGQLSGRDAADAEADLYIICDGARQVQRVRADAEGRFEYRWPLTGTLMGHVTAGICYPGEGLKSEMAAFDIYGLRRTNTGYIKFQPTVGTPIEAAIELENPGQLPLTGVTVSVVSKPDSYDFTCSLDQTIDGGGKPKLLYTMTANAPATGSDWDQIKLLVTTDEGVELPLTIYSFARMAEASLKTPQQRITTTMVKGETREYPIQLINIGQGATGTLTVALPDWIKCAQGATLSGINPGDTATLVLLFTPTDDMQLNVPVTGTIGYNVQYGSGTYANFSVTPVSDKTGTLVVEVADEYTYYTDEKPRVKDADVVLRNSVTNAIVMIDGREAKGKSDDSGLVTFENLPEGYYKLSVSADNHDSYSNNIVVDPGVTTRKTVNLSVQAIKVSWTVEETEIEDVYDIVTTVTYETNVPTPIVDIVVPSRLPLDSLAEGESLMFYAIATNKGLITALNSEISIPERTGIYVWEAMGEKTGLTIAPQQSYILPVKVTRQTPASPSRRFAGGDNGCTTVTAVTYEWVCGNDRKWHKVEKPITYSVCPGKPVGGSAIGWGGGGGGGGLGSPGGGGGGGYTPSSSTTHVSSTSDCNPCLDALGRWVVECVQNFIPVWGCTKGIYECATSEESGASKAIDCTLTTVACAAETCGYAATATVVGAGVGVVCEIVGWIANGLTCCKQFWKASERCWDFIFSDESRAAKGAGGTMRRGNSIIMDMPPFNNANSYVNKLAKAVRVSQRQLQGLYDYLTEVMGDSRWVDNTKMSEVENLLAVVSTYRGEQMTIDNLRPYKPEGVTDEMLQKFVERINNTRFYDETGIEPEGDRISIDRLNAAVESINIAEATAVDEGYSSVEEMWNEALGEAYEKLTEQKGSVCASISLQIKQTMTMTRQAFRGTLTVFNGHETEAMKDMKLNLVVSDHNNNVATAHEFQINAEVLKNLDGPLTLDGGWTLAPNSEGTVTVLFIPTKYAAPTEPVEYSFGGELSYLDPYSGLVVTRELYPVTLTVKPSPELDLTYFMQRDVYGDDPLTKDVVEPMENAEFALLINNKGYGDATNVKMTTMQPEIIDNEKGLAIDFQIVSSQVNGGPAALSFGQTIANDLGTIAAHSQTYAQWWLQSTLLGHFTTYKVEATHVTSYGNEDLSLLDLVTIHELIHGFTPPAVEGTASPARGFLVNDVTDAQDMPDQVYFTDATQQEVTVATSATTTKQSGAEYWLTVMPKQAGWTYATLLDPTAGRQKLLKVVRRSDGQELPLDNVWQTSRSLRDGQEWLYENRLHIVASLPAAGDTYVLTYEERPNLELDVLLSEPVYDTEFAAQHLVTADVDEVTVTFTKPIVAETFTADDVTLSVQGEKQDLTAMTITADEGSGNTTFTLGMSNLNATLPNGYYVLTVQTNDITDEEGFQGLSGRKIDWVLFRGGLVVLNATPLPLDGGQVAYVVVDDAAGARSSQHRAPEQGGVVYGAKYRLTATPEEGFEFVNWTIGDDVVSVEPVYELTANSDINIVANFKKKQFRLEVAADAGGTLRGAGTGLYDYNSAVEIEAVPQEDFKLKGWQVDGTDIATADNPLTLTVTQPTAVKALFERDIYLQTLTMARGWNWVSTFMNEQQSLGDVVQYASRIVSQEDELISDPVYGMVGGIDAFVPGKAYKIEASQRFSRSLRGHLYNTAAAPVALRQGWNWLAYPYCYSKVLATVVANATEGDYIASQQGFAEFADDQWHGTLSELTPGMGYLYKSADAKSLAFNFEGVAPAGSRRAIGMADAAMTVIDPHRYPNTMNMTARLYRDGMELPAAGYQVYALAGEELRGMSVAADDRLYLTVYGDRADDISFLVEQAESGEQYVATEMLTFVDDVVGSYRQPFALTISSPTGITLTGADHRPMTVYSLEGVLVSRDATLKTLSRLPKGVYIVNGKKRFIK